MFRSCQDHELFLSLISLLLQIVEPVDLFWKCGLANPHTSHCLGNGQIMISTMGDPSGNGKGKMLCSPLCIFNTHFRLTLLFMVISKVVLCCWMARLSKWLATGSSQVKQHHLVMTSGISLATMSWSALSGEHPKHWETASTLHDVKAGMCTFRRKFMSRRSRLAVMIRSVCRSLWTAPPCVGLDHTQADSDSGSGGRWCYSSGDPVPARPCCGWRIRGLCASEHRLPLLQDSGKNIKSAFIKIFSNLFVKAL